MADNRKPSSQQAMTGLMKAFQKLSPTKRQYAEITQSNSSISSSSSGSKYNDSSSGRYTPLSEEGRTSARASTSTQAQKPASSQQKGGTSSREDEQKLLRKLQTTFGEASNLLNEYVDMRSRKK
ncbi:uncharacterized protein LOC103579101 [Microplitis demolitor]|nr:uncharacterized protein LOC103579101 [Microplitis demolitor]XP_053592930.1 uncharacterized protein LOC103579101 [Microplitis demolitor]XP_053592931.1 uncharacterized protein LOC103579101 [Microplitis demolitor]